jgi:hypothetical protein
MGAMQTIEHAQAKPINFPSLFRTNRSAMRTRATLQSAWWENLAPYINTKTTDCPPPDMGDTGYTNGPKGDDNNEKQQVLHNTATAAAWRERGP